MKTKILKFSFIAFIGITIWACTKESENINDTSNNQIQSSNLEQDLRQQIIISGEHLSFLSNEQFLNVQTSKLNQLLTNNLPQVEVNLINNLKIELVKYSNNQPNSIISIVNQLAYVIPEDDFILMFMELEDYSYNGGYVGQLSVSPEIIEEISMLAFRPGGNGNDSGEPKKVICDCNWTCGSPSTVCIQKSSGCGFLWMYPCTQTDWISPEPS